MKVRHALGSSIVLVTLLTVVSGSAEDTTAEQRLGRLLAERRPTPPSNPDLARLEARLEELARRPDAGRTASGALGVARDAVQRVRVLIVAGRLRAAERAKQIAWAAMSLADRQVAAYQAAAAAAAAERRATEAEAQAASASAALASARVQLAEVEAADAQGDGRESTE